MLSACEKRFGGAIKLVQGDIRDLGKLFAPEEFDVLISAATIHNIPRAERGGVWSSIRAVGPRLFVSADKIADSDPQRHLEYYRLETEAIVRVYRDRHGLGEVSDEWLRHYEVDERERLLLTEMETALGRDFTLSLAAEFGMTKTVKATPSV